MVNQVTKPTSAQCGLRWGLEGLLLLGLASAAAKAQSPRLVGQVRVAPGDVETGGAVVEIYNSHELLADRTLTDTKGQFYFVGLAPDEYTLAVSKPGYYTVETHVAIYYGVKEQYVTVFLTQQPTGPEAKPGKVSAAELALPSKSRREFQKGKEALRKNKYAVAIVLLKAVNQAEPRFALGFEVLGVAYLRAGKLPDAEKAFHQALDIDAKMPDSLFQLGLLHYQRNELAESERYLARGLDLEPQSLFGHYQHGLTLFALEKYNDSAREFQQALQIDPSFSEAHVRLANVYLRQQNPSQALAEFERYLHDAPKGPFAPRAREVVREMRASGITSAVPNPK